MQARIHSFGGMKKCWRASFRALLALAPLTLAAQELTLHVDVKLVNVFVNVIDQNGALAAGLTREDFALPRTAGRSRSRSSSASRSCR
jgi:hypothetical protein